MITNQQQYEVTLNRIKLFEQALESFDAEQSQSSQQNNESSLVVHSVLTEAQRNAMVSVLNELREQVQTYNNRKTENDQ